MGAYSNPQEIEGQQDLGGYSRALQSMFDKIAGGVQNATENIIKRNKENAAKNGAIVKELNEKAQGLQVLVEKGKAAGPKELNYNCYDTAIDRWLGLQTKIDKGEGSPNDKREVAQILASVDGFVKGAADTNGIIQKVHTAKNNIGDGQIDLQGSDPYMFRAYVALDSKDGDKIQPGFQTSKDADGNVIIDYSQPGYNVTAWKETGPDGKEISHKEQFISAKKLNESLNGGSNGGIVFQKSFEGDNEKIRKAYQVGQDGSGIFEYKNDVYTNRVSADYLSNSYARSTQVGTQGTGGVTRQLMKTVDKEKVLKAVGTQIESVATASASNPKEAASRYFNYVLKATDADNPNKDQYAKLPEYAKFKKMPDDFSYDTPIDINNDKGLINTITYNSKAAFAQALPDNQPFGNPITISDKDLLWEKQANKKVPAPLLKAWKEVGGKDGVPVIKTITLPDGKVRNVLIGKDKDGVFLEIVGYNTKQ